ncbi:MAG TPA: M17 family peptidase N-terminal domain-containing protein [Labilithrix sp.]|nr:M17 family peptidase N-terminal domain-containing protein [Labilithrix sp.]
MLDLRFVPRALRNLDEVSAEIVACGIYRDARPLAGLAGLLDWRLAGRLSRLTKQGFLRGEVGELLAMPVRPRLPFDKLIVAGLGPRGAFGDSTFKKVLDRTMTTLAGLHVKKAVVELPGRGDDAIAAERAAEIVLELIGDEERDGLTFVEDPNDQQRIEKHTQERRRSMLRAASSGL